MPNIKKCNFPIDKENEICYCKRKIKIKEDHKYCHQHREKSEPPVCTICLEYIEKRKLTQTICKHHFHKKCLHRHIRQSTIPVCPNCRAPIEDVYSLSTMEISLPTFHLVQHTPNSTVEEDDRRHIIKFLISEWLDMMKQASFSLVAVHVGDMPFDGQISENYTSHYIERLNLFIVALDGDDNIHWPQ